MAGFPDLDQVRRRLGSALELVQQDRWLLGGLRDGRVRVIADSRPEALRRRPTYRPLSPLARRCLYERRTLAVSAMLVDPAHDVLAGDDWETKWPALLYAPVGVPQSRPVGVMILGSRRQHWYKEDEISYVTSIAVTLTTCVLTVTGPLGRLSPRERLVANLLREGMSGLEIGRALAVALPEAEALVGGVLQKLSLRSRQQLADVFPEQMAISDDYLC